MKEEPRWVFRESVELIHRLQIGQHGGPIGLRDRALLESALARPVHLWHYEKPTLFRLAAAYAFGIVRNHPFVDGNKRTGFVVSVLFIELNGFTYVASEVESALQFIALAAGELDEIVLAEWFAANSQPVATPEP